MTGLSEGLAQLARDPETPAGATPHDARRLRDLEHRLAGLESRLKHPAAAAERPSRGSRRGWPDGVRPDGTQSQGQGLTASTGRSASSRIR